MNYVFLVLKKFDSSSKNIFLVNFWFISGSISAEKIILENYNRTKRFVFEIHVESLQQFLSYRAYFRR